MIIHMEPKTPAKIRASPLIKTTLMIAFQKTRTAIAARTASTSTTLTSGCGLPGDGVAGLTLLD